MIFLRGVVLISLLGAYTILGANLKSTKPSFYEESLTKYRYIAVRFATETLQNVNNFIEEVLCFPNAYLTELEKNHDSKKSLENDLIEVLGMFSSRGDDDGHDSSKKVSHQEIDEKIRHPESVESDLSDSSKEKDALEEQLPMADATPSSPFLDFLKRMLHLDSPTRAPENKQGQTQDTGRIGLQIGNSDTQLLIILSTCISLMLICLCHWWMTDEVPEHNFEQNDEPIEQLLEMVNNNQNDLSENLDYSIVFLQNVESQTIQQIENGNFVVHEVVERIEGLKHIIYEKQGEAINAREYMNDGVQSTGEEMDESGKVIQDEIEEFKEKLQLLEALANRIYMSTDEEVETLPSATQRSPNQ